MPNLNKILFPVDFSARCIGAARYVEALAGRFDSEILLLHVVENGANSLAQELYPTRKIQLEAFLADELKYFTTERICIIADDAAQRIVDTARSVAARSGDDAHPWVRSLSPASARIGYRQSAG